MVLVVTTISNSKCNKNTLQIIYSKENLSKIRIDLIMRFVW